MGRLTSETSTLPTGEALTLRSAEPGDAAVLLEFLRTAAATTDQIATQPDEYPATAEAEAEILRDYEENPGALMLLTLHAGQIISCASLHAARQRRVAHAARLGITVAAEWRGRGVGRRVMERLIAWARDESPLEKISLEVYDTNPLAIALYHKLGFVQEGRQRSQTRFAPGRYADQITMGLFVKPGPPREFTVRRMVQFAETDMAGVMNFGNYIHWMEQAEHAFYRSMGMTIYEQGQEEIVSWPRVAVKCEYYAPLRFEDQVELAVRVAALSERSQIIEVEFRLDGRRVAVGSMTSVCCRLAEGTFQSIPIPPRIRERLERMIKSQG